MNIVSVLLAAAFSVCDYSIPDPSSGNLTGMYTISVSQGASICLNSTAFGVAFVMYQVPNTTTVSFYRPAYSGAAPSLVFTAPVPDSPLVLRAVEPNSSYALQAPVGVYIISTVYVDSCPHGIHVVASSHRRLRFATGLSPPWVSSGTIKCVLCVNTDNTTIDMSYRVPDTSNIQVFLGASLYFFSGTRSNATFVKPPGTVPALIRAGFTNTPGFDPQLNISISTENDVEIDRFMFTSISSRAVPTPPTPPAEVRNYRMDVGIGYSVSLGLLAATLVGLIVLRRWAGKSPRRQPDQWSTSSVAVVAPAPRLS